MGGTAGTAGAGAAAGGGAAGAGVDPTLPMYVGSVGTWCGPGDEETIWLTASAEQQTCDVSASEIYSTDPDHVPGDGIVLTLPADALTTLPAELMLPLSFCEAGVCSDVQATVSLSTYTPGTGATGTWSATLPSGETAEGQINAGWCAWDDQLPAHPEGEQLARDISIADVAVYQAVKVSLLENGAALSPEERNAPVVQGRPAYVRVFVEPQAAWQEHEVAVRLTLTTGTEETVFEDTKSVSGASSDGQLQSTFNFELPEEAFGEDTEYLVEIRETSSCTELQGTAQNARFPATGAEPLQATDTGPVYVTFVPVRYDADGSGRLPDTSDSALDALYDAVLAHYPTTDLIYDVREPVGTDSSNFTQILNQLRTLREDDNPDAWVNYYGLVAPADTLREYCGRGCVAGIATLSGGGFGRGPTGGVGLGLSFEEAAQGTFIHELGHEVGRQHTNCGGADQPDPDFPYPQGDMGSWGFDPRSLELLDPNDGYKDFMGYCDPTWISDYTYAGIAERLVELNDIAMPLRVGPPAPPQTWLTLLLDETGAPSWGLPIRFRSEPDGIPEVAEVLDASLNVLLEVEVFRVTLGDTDAAQLSVPEPEPGWEAIRVAGAPPISFAEIPVVNPLSK